MTSHKDSDKNHDNITKRKWEKRYLEATRGLCHGMKSDSGQWVCKETSNMVFWGKISLFLKKEKKTWEIYKSLYLFQRPGYDSWNFISPATSLKKVINELSEGPENCKKEGLGLSFMMPAYLWPSWSVRDNKFPYCLNKTESDIYFTWAKALNFKAYLFAAFLELPPESYSHNRFWTH